MQDAYVVLAQVLPVLVLGLLAEVRTMALEGKRGYSRKIGIGFATAMAILFLGVEVWILAKIAAGSYVGLEGEGAVAALVVIVLVPFVGFAISTLLALAVVIEGRSAREAAADG